MRYSYIKKVHRHKKPIFILLSMASLVIGTATLLWSFYPIITFQLSQLFSFSQPISPLPRSVLAASLQKGLMVYDETNKPYYSSYLKDFTKVGNWFPKKQQLIHKSKVNEYELTVPKLGISGANVHVGGEDLARSLVQFGDYVLPGEIGNIPILGHSTLPQLYKSKDYKSIFTYLPTLERGDKVKLIMGGFTYEYIVYDMFIVDPNETWVLEPKADEPVVTLISCVPPGTFWKRLVVKARFIGI